MSLRCLFKNLLQEVIYTPPTEVELQKFLEVSVKCIRQTLLRALHVAGHVSLCVYMVTVQLEDTVVSKSLLSPTYVAFYLKVTLSLLHLFNIFSVLYKA